MCRISAYALGSWPGRSIGCRRGWTGFGRRPFLRRPAGRSWTCTGPREASSGAAVYVWGDGEAVPEEAVGELQEKLNGMCPLGVTVTVQGASTKKVAVGATLRMRQGADYSAASAAVTAAIKAWLGKRSVGESVYMADIQRVILDADPGVGRVEFLSASKDHEGALGVVPIAGMVSLKEGT